MVTRWSRPAMLTSSEILTRGISAHRDAAMGRVSRRAVFVVLGCSSDAGDVRNTTPIDVRAKKFVFDTSLASLLLIFRLILRCRFLRF